MKPLIALTILTFAVLNARAQSETKFIHPGIAHSQASIDIIKAKLAAGEEPWASAWTGVKASRRAEVSHKPEPRAKVERGPYNNPNIGSSEFSRDASAAYTHAVCWALSGDARHARKAMEIVDAWSGTLESISNHDARLLVGMEGYEFCIAAELLKHTWDGWPEANQRQFAMMLREIFYPLIRDFYPTANGNWDAAMLQTMMAMGVFLDDRAMFDRAKDYFLKGEGNGAIGMYFSETGQCQESGRDQGHTQMGLEFLSNTCETAWIQGVDLYSALDDRLLKGFEYTAKYNLGFDVPYEPYESYQGRYHYKSISDKARGRLRPMYEKVLSHYQNRRGKEAPFTKQAAIKLRSAQDERSERRGRRNRRSSHFDTLMFAGQGRQQAAVPTATGSRNDRKPPNVVIFLVDDLGYMDIGANNPECFYDTPNIDALAKSGMRFTDGYAANPVCSPTRYSLMTGKHPSRVDATNFFVGKRSAKFDPAPMSTRMELEEVTLAEMLKKKDYATFFAGKWHLGENEKYYPQNQGFDINVGGHHRGGPYTGRKYFSPFENPQMKDSPPGDHMPDRLARDTAAFIDDHKDKPFLAYLSFYSVHTPLMGRPDLVKKYEGKAKAITGEEFADEEQVFSTDKPRRVRILQKHAVYAAMVEAMDAAVGKVLKQLEDSGVADNTLVVFTSDNGGLSTSEGSPTSNLPLRGGKGWVYEGGIREPWIIRYPGVTKAGSVSDQVVCSIDLFPTVAAAAGIEFEHAIDGINLAAALKGDALPVRSLYWHYPHYSNQGGIPSGAIREGDYKLIERYEDGQIRLYHLKDDIGERTNLASKFPEKVSQMRAKLHQWYQEVDAKFLQKREGGPDPWRP